MHEITILMINDFDKAFTPVIEIGVQKVEYKTFEDFI